MAKAGDGRLRRSHSRPGGVDGEPRATHWDDPMLAAAEQAAANVREATGTRTRRGRRRGERRRRRRRWSTRRAGGHSPTTRHVSRHAAPAPGAPAAGG